MTDLPILDTLVWLGLVGVSILLAFVSGIRYEAWRWEKEEARFMEDIGEA